MERTWTPGTRRIEVPMPLVGRACLETDNVRQGFDARSARRTEVFPNLLPGISVQ